MSDRLAIGLIMVAAVVWFILNYIGIRPTWIRDIRDQLPNGPGAYNRRDLEQIRRIVIHHSGSPVTDTPEKIAGYHVQPGNHICDEGCPGIAYHYLIDYEGRVYQVNDLETISYHALGNNTDTLGICLIGDYNVLEPTPRQWRRLKVLIRHLQIRLGRQLEIIGHRDVKNTTCPGANIDTSKLSGHAAASHILP